MNDDSSSVKRNRSWRFLGFAIVAGAIGAGLAVLYQVTSHPRTDDAEVFANLIGIAPEVYGRIVKINVRDNQYVHRGQLLFEVDPLPYEYALEKAESQQAQLEGQIRDLQRAVSAQTTGILVARARSRSAQAKIASAESNVQAARAELDGERAQLSRAQADYGYAEDNLLRLEPLLVKQYVTEDQVDQARTSRSVQGEAVRLARARLAQAEARWASAVAERDSAQADAEQSTAGLEQSIQGVSLLDPLIAQREFRAAAVKDAAYNLQRCKVYAPFDARVTNLTISEGAYAHIGQQAFLLIDTRVWWVIGNFRETDLKRIRPGMKADVYIMSRSTQKIAGTVESTGFGVAPDPTLVGNFSRGLPDVQRSLNWVHLATRFPVRVRIDSAPPELMRIGASATVIVQGDGHTSR